MTMPETRRLARNATATVLLILLAAAAQPAQSHVVSPSELRKHAVAASETRRRNADAVNGFLSSPKAEKALASAGIDAAQVKAAVSSLEDEELARLSARTQQAQADFAAGRLSDRDLIWILIGIAALILIIVAVR
jgi:hypothetical protein